jgi:hypothetical protein
MPGGHAATSFHRPLNRAYGLPGVEPVTAEPAYRTAPGAVKSRFLTSKSRLLTSWAVPPDVAMGPSTRGAAENVVPANGR